MKKTYRYDDEIIFYFDAFDNKYVASGGSLAWRLNNPGLLLSHSLYRTGYKAIGAYHQYAIFSHPLLGQEALRAWICSTKYYDSPLIEIAKYYQPSHPEKYLSELCAITGFAPQTIPRSLLTNDFEKLLRALQKLAGFSPENEHQMSLLPKITARFYTVGRKVEYYLAGYDNLLSKNQALEWVETHKLDAVIVHKSNGEVYLRSRPGHHFDQIRFKQKDYGTEKEFKDAVREVGNEKEGQCVWGFINGLFNKPDQALESAAFISNVADGEHVLYLVNDAPRSLSDVVAQKLGYHSESVKFAAQFFKTLIELSEQTTSQNKPKIVVFSHSQGALIANLALSRLSSKERQRIRLFTLGGAAWIEPDAAHPESHNYFSLADLISKPTSYTFCNFLLRLHDGKNAGLKPEQVIEQLILEDIEMRLETRDPKAVAKFRRQREGHYVHELWKSQNITILNEGTSKIFEHAFKSPCYQQKVIEIINKYKD